VADGDYLRVVVRYCRGGLVVASLLLADSGGRVAPEYLAMMKRIIAGVLVVLVAGSGIPASAQDTGSSQDTCAWTKEHHLVDLLGVCPVPPPPPPPPEYKFFSPTLQGVGVVSILVGGALIIGQGQTYSILGDKYCVTEYAVDYGSCYDPTLARIGLYTISAGVMMILIGHHRVLVTPTVSQAQKSVTATVRWGGKRK